MRTGVTLTNNSKGKIIFEGSSFPTTPFPRDFSKLSVPVRPIAAYFEPKSQNWLKPVSMGRRILERKFY